MKYCCCIRQLQYVLSVLVCVFCSAVLCIIVGSGEFQDSFYLPVRWRHIFKHTCLLVWTLYPSLVCVLYCLLRSLFLYVCEKPVIGVRGRYFGRGCFLCDLPSWGCRIVFLFQSVSCLLVSVSPSFLFAGFRHL